MSETKSSKTGVGGASLLGRFNTGEQWLVDCSFFVFKSLTKREV